MAVEILTSEDSGWLDVVEACQGSFVTPTRWFRPVLVRESPPPPPLGRGVRGRRLRSEARLTAGRARRGASHVRKGAWEQREETREGGGFPQDRGLRSRRFACRAVPPGGGRGGGGGCRAVSGIRFRAVVRLPPPLLGSRAVTLGSSSAPARENRERGAHEKRPSSATETGAVFGSPPPSMAHTRNLCPRHLHMRRLSFLRLGLMALAPCMSTSFFTHVSASLRRSRRPLPPTTPSPLCLSWLRAWRRRRRSSDPAALQG